jgi:hypothetical protein
MSFIEALFIDVIGVSRSRQSTLNFCVLLNIVIPRNTPPIADPVILCPSGPFSILSGTPRLNFQVIPVLHD